MSLARLVRAPLVALSAVFLGVALAACSPQGESTAQTTKAEVNPYLGDVVMGEAKAPVEIVEYASLTCGHCRNFWVQVFPRIKTAYIDTGKARFILRDFPTDQLAVGGAAVARCAGKDQYYAVIDRMFKSFNDLADAARRGEGGRFISTIAADFELSPNQVAACVNHPGVTELVNKTIQQGRKAQMDAGKAENEIGTPAVFVNGKYIEDHSFESLSAAIESALNPAAAPAAAAPAATAQ